MIVDKILIHIPTSKLTLSQVRAFIRKYKLENPDVEVFLDGDAHSIVERRNVY